jgi:hypothetical protein
MQQPWTLRLILNAAALEAARPILLFSDWRKRVSSLTNCSHSRFLTSALRTLTWIFFETKTVVCYAFCQVLIAVSKHVCEILAVNTDFFDHICGLGVSHSINGLDQSANLVNAPLLEWLSLALARSLVGYVLSMHNSHALIQQLE